MYKCIYASMRYTTRPRNTYVNAKQLDLERKRVLLKAHKHRVCPQTVKYVRIHTLSPNQLERFCFAGSTYT